MRDIFLLFGILLFFSCSREVTELPALLPEEVNGFQVVWRKNVTSEQKNVIRSFLQHMVKVEGGRFVLGATPEQHGWARSNEYPPCHVCLSDFYICKYEVSEEEYMTIVDDPRASTYSRLSLSWEDWFLFIQILQEISGVRFDFPTEAQWEYAARGGIYSKGYIFPGSNNLEEVWTDSEKEGSSVPNELGLYNMADLKSEWCKDRYESYIGDRYYVDRYVAEGEHQVVRGGNYKCSGETSEYLNGYGGDSFGYYKSPGTLLSPFDFRYCRSTARSYYYVPSESLNGSGNSYYIGCRLVINQ